MFDVGFVIDNKLDKILWSRVKAEEINDAGINYTLENMEFNAARSSGISEYYEIKISVPYENQMILTLRRKALKNVASGFLA